MENIRFTPTENVIRGHAWYDDTGRFFLYREVLELYLTDREEKKLIVFPYLFSFFDWCEENGQGTPKFRQEVCKTSSICDIIAEGSKIKLGVRNMTTASNVLQELLTLVQDVKTNADYAKSDIEEKQSKLEDLHTEIEDGLNSVDDFITRLEDLDEVITNLEERVQDFESEF